MGSVDGPPISFIHRVHLHDSIHTPQPRHGHCPPPRARGGLSPCAPAPPPREARPWPWRLTPRRPPQPLPLRCAFPTLCPPRASPRRLSLGAAAAAGFGSAPAGADRVCRGAEKVAPTWRAWGACWAAYSAGAAATTGRPRGRSTPTPWRASTPWSPKSPRSQTPTCAHAPPRSRTALAPGNPWIPFSPYVSKYNGHCFHSNVSNVESKMDFSSDYTKDVTVCDHESNVSR